VIVGHFSDIFLVLLPIEWGCKYLAFSPQIKISFKWRINLKNI